MKKAYSMPTITVEELQLDKPIALGCEANYDDINSLIKMGYFADSTCTIQYNDDIFSDGDTVCYHSNVIKAFLS